MKVQGKLFRVTSRNDIQGSLWGRIKIVDHGTIWVSNFFGQLPTIHGSPSSQRLISYILSYAFDKTIKRDTKCFEKSFLASAHPRLICYQLLLIFSEMNFSRSHFRWHCITHVLFNSFQTNIGFYSQHKKWSFRLRISSINVTKSSGDCGSGFIFTEENLIPQTILAVARGGGGYPSVGIPKMYLLKTGCNPRFCDFIIKSHVFPEIFIKIPQVVQ